MSLSSGAKGEVPQPGGYYLRQEQIESFEANIVPGETSGEDIYGAFRELALTTGMTQKALELVKMVGSVDEYTRAMYGIYSYYDPSSQRHLLDIKDKLGGEFEFPIYVHGYINGLARYGEVFRSEAEAVDTVGAAATARQFSIAYKSQIEKAPDIETFAQRMHIATQPYCLERMAEDDSEYRMVHYKQRLWRQTAEFMEANPEHAEQAFRLWESALAVAALSGKLSVRLHSQFFTTFEEDKQTIEIAGVEYEFQNPYFTEQIEEKIRLMKLAKEPKSIVQLTAQVAFGEYGPTPETLALIDDYQSIMLTDPPRGRGKLMQAGVDIFRKYLEFAAPHSALASQLDTLISAQRPGFSGFAQLANQPLIYNLVSEGLGKEKGLHEQEDAEEKLPEIESLDPSKPDSLPLALDRLRYAVEQDMKALELEKSTAELLDKLGHAASLAATVGATQKLAEHVVTLSDLVIRYSSQGKSPEQTRDMIELLQTANGSEVAAHIAYRDLRSLSKNRRNRAHFMRWVPGKGVLT